MRYPFSGGSLSDCTVSQSCLLGASKFLCEHKPSQHRVWLCIACVSAHNCRVFISKTFRGGGNPQTFSSKFRRSPELFLGGSGPNFGANFSTFFDQNFDIFGSSFGYQIWSPKLEPKICFLLKFKCIWFFGPNFGNQIWYPKLEPKTCRFSIFFEEKIAKILPRPIRPLPETP